MTKRPLAFVVSRDDWKFRVYTLLDAAFEGNDIVDEPTILSRPSLFRAVTSVSK